MPIEKELVMLLAVMAVPIMKMVKMEIGVLLEVAVALAKPVAAVLAADMALVAAVELIMQIHLRQFITTKPVAKAQTAWSSSFGKEERQCITSI